MQVKIAKTRINQNKNYKLAPGYILVKTNETTAHDKLFEAEVVMSGAFLSDTDLDAGKCRQVWLRVPRGAVDGIVHMWNDEHKVVLLLKKEYLVVCNEINMNE